MASKFNPGDRVRAKSAWSGRSQGKGTVVTVANDGAPEGCGIVLDRDKSGLAAHFYDSELTKANERR
jgi:hypothetical protein